MIEWIQHWDEMRFYYHSGLSNLILIPTYVGGFLLIMVVCWGLGKAWKPLWLLAIPALAYLAVAPMWEEFGIAYTFGQLCKKDAGIFVYKTVEVDGFYDATRPTTAEPWSKKSGEELDARGYKFYEMPVPDFKGGPAKIAHLEKVNSAWTTTLLDQPTARYRYAMTHMDTPMGHKVKKIERVVDDRQTMEVLARETKYKREAPWYFVGLDRPVMLCPSPGEHSLSQYGSVFNLALKPRSDN